MVVTDGSDVPATSLCIQTPSDPLLCHRRMICRFIICFTPKTVLSSSAIPFTNAGFHGIGVTQR